MSLRGMGVADLWKFAPCNLDPLTETYSYSFYVEYMRKWPQLCRVMEGPKGDIEGYSKSFFPYISEKLFYLSLLRMNGYIHFPEDRVGQDKNEENENRQSNLHL